MILIDKIQDYSQICLYRHINPDDDALGSQYGLYYFIKEYFPSIDVILMGDFSNELMRRYDSSLIKDYKDIKTLGIVLDTANRERIDGDISICDEIIKIDHHIIVDNFGDINIVDEHASSTCELLTNLLSQDYTLNKNIGICFYRGMITDSNRFLYRNTTTNTFKAAMILLETGIDIESIYQELYVTKEQELLVTKHILNSYKTNGKVIYYYLSDNDLKTLQISRQVGSHYVNTIANIEEYPIYMSLTENIEEDNIRVSIRSLNKPINHIAEKFRGGGHELAAGATLLSLDELDSLLKELNEV